uniref:Uncharacterized protein n=1 Tax=Chionoecetes opilio bacilliform virus TaxID=1825681 RepID=A0A1Q3DL10_9VIRU|nr:hypothetical protein [Chionoecetes opilio bacilliform virus]GAV93190.1 hypothetical protein SCV_067 [Chionoecetes opilio bacilliform virus]
MYVIVTASQPQRIEFIPVEFLKTERTTAYITTAASTGGVAASTGGVAASGSLVVAASGSLVVAASGSLVVAGVVAPSDGVSYSFSADMD